VRRTGAGNSLSKVLAAAGSRASLCRKGRARERYINHPLEVAARPALYAALVLSLV
jgi:hypothetical protein